MKIMIVDDEEEIRYIEERILKKAGYEVITAKNGRECFENLKNVRPDLIFMDVMMPEMDGWEITKLIKEDDDTKDIPVVIVTIKGSDDSKTRSFIYAHADGHLVKPIVEKELLETASWALKGGTK